ncbi:hypothetical protein EI164_00790 [Psychrobacter sp. FME13]|uniref:hypothetical protein n=1 Tax=Psychrobacter sp. FME13 TaxID=2487708 RepID=UPI00178875F5|nr:hypothetical protein [Psychrobacter sp. FME13]MBE0440615.1 hypothetical protein [Psychrobacter sp. FME13]
MKLSDITEKTQLVKDFVNQLKKSTKQAIPIVEVGKTARVSGASARPVNMVLENGQTIKLFLRVVTAKDDKNKDIERFDIFRIDINGKAQPLSGDYDNSYRPAFDASVKALGNMLRTGQAAFDKKRAKQKIRKPRTGAAPKNKTQQLNELVNDAADLDKTIESKTKEKEGLEQQLNNLTSQP